MAGAISCCSLVSVRCCVSRYITEQGLRIVTRTPGKKKKKELQADWAWKGGDGSLSGPRQLWGSWLAPWFPVSLAWGSAQLTLSLPGNPTAPLSSRGPRFHLFFWIIILRRQEVATVRGFWGSWWWRAPLPPLRTPIRGQWQRLFVVA